MSLHLIVGVEENEQIVVCPKFAFTQYPGVGNCHGDVLCTICVSCNPQMHK